MYELIQAGENTYYINCPAKMGIYAQPDDSVILIDSGGDKDAGKKVLRILDERNWRLTTVINTHSNADHIGGNKLLQDRTGCHIYAFGLERVFCEFPVLEPSFLYGGFPNNALRNKFLLAEASVVQDISGLTLPEGMEIIPLKGHFFDMIGIKTPDNVYFLADSIFGEHVLNKYHISFIYDVAEYLNTLNRIETLEGRLFVPAHADAADSIKSLADINKKKVFEIIGRIERICQKPSSFETILKTLFDEYALSMDFNQYVLVGSTVRSYLSYMLDNRVLSAGFDNNMLMWTRV